MLFKTLFALSCFRIQARCSGKMILFYTGPVAVNPSMSCISSLWVQSRFSVSTLLYPLLRSMIRSEPQVCEELHQISLQLMFKTFSAIQDRGFGHNNLFSHLLFLSLFYQRLSGRDTCCLCFVWHDHPGYLAKMKQFPKQVLIIDGNASTETCSSTFHELQIFQVGFILFLMFSKCLESPAW